jgi:hypothetical protein
MGKVFPLGNALALWLLVTRDLAGPALSNADAAQLMRQTSQCTLIGRHAPVAQMDRALPSEGRGREFESLRAHHLKI